MNKKVKHWVVAFRLRTLPLALSSIGMGGFLAVSHHTFKLAIFLLAVLTTIFLQILSNLANDYGDYKHGADNEDRKGPRRAVESGAISADEMKRAIWILAFLSFGTGIYLLYTAFNFLSPGFLGFLILGLVCIAAAIKYTAGKNPYGYSGYGDISVFVFFGIVGVIGTYYVQAGNIFASLILPAAACGFFATGVLNINNIRDIESDSKAGKKSIPVRIGKKNAKVYHIALLGGGMLCPVVYTIQNFYSFAQLLFLISYPLFIINGLKVWEKESSEELDPLLKQMALSTLFFVICFGIGLLIAF